MKNHHSIQNLKSSRFALAALAFVLGGVSAHAGDTSNIVTDIISRMDVMAGAATTSPFQVTGSGTSFHLTNNGQVMGIIQVNYRDRWGWAPALTNASTDAADAKTEWVPLSLNNLDFQVRAGYLFNQSGTNATTTLGTGDFAGEFAIGNRVAQTHSINAPFVHSVNFPELNVSIVTDRNFSDSHTTLMLGPAYVASFIPPFSTNGERARFLVRTGAALYDSPNLPGGSVVADNGHGAPQFHTDVGWGVETEMAYPVSTGMFISAGARVYPGHYPTGWTVWLGVSYSFDNIKTAVQKLVPFVGS